MPCVRHGWKTSLCERTHHHMAYTGIMEHFCRAPKAIPFSLEQKIHCGARLFSTQDPGKREARSLRASYHRTGTIRHQDTDRGLGIQQLVHVEMYTEGLWLWQKPPAQQMTTSVLVMKDFLHSTSPVLLDAGVLRTYKPYSHCITLRLRNSPRET